MTKKSMPAKATGLVLALVAGVAAIAMTFGGAPAATAEDRPTASATVHRNGDASHAPGVQSSSPGPSVPSGSDDGVLHDVNDDGPHHEANDDGVNHDANDDDGIGHEANDDDPHRGSSPSGHGDD